MFGEAITCNSHSAWVSMNVDPSENDGNDEGDDTFVLSFSNCSIKDGHTFEDYMAATKQWNEYAAEHGFRQAGWVWFPIVRPENCMQTGFRLASTSAGMSS